MGNCVLKRLNGDHHHHHVQVEANQQMMIKVATTNGGIMELYAPITADQITAEFPGHALFRGPEPACSAPLLYKEPLHPGHLYYLLPLSYARTAAAATASPSKGDAAAPYRISVDDPRVELKRSDPDRVPRCNRGKGVWKVRLVINPEQLSEILSQDSRTEELIENVRAVAKCGNTASATKSPAVSSKSDEGSVSSTCNFHWRAYVKETTQPKCSVDG